MDSTTGSEVSIGTGAVEVGAGTGFTLTFFTTGTAGVDVETFDAAGTEAEVLESAGFAALLAGATDAVGVLGDVDSVSSFCFFFTLKEHKNRTIIITTSTIYLLINKTLT